MYNRSFGRIIDLLGGLWCRVRLLRWFKVLMLGVTSRSSLQNCSQSTSICFGLRGKSYSH